MADTPSSILLLRLQSTGSNTNLWGGYINTAMQTQERAAKGYQAYTVTGDATISWTNYSASNDIAVALVKLIGSPTAAATLTAPSYQNSVTIWNACGQAVTIKCSGGTGVTIPNGMRTRIYCDGTDYYSGASNWLNNYATTLTNAGDVVTKATMESAIAALLASTVAGLVFNTSADPTPNYLANKLTGAGAVSTVTTNPGTASEKTTISVQGFALVLQSEQTTGFTASALKIWPVNFSSNATTTFPASATAGDIIGILNYGTAVNTINFNGLKYNGSTNSQATNAKGLGLFMYTGATQGWTDV
jgi:hypothetical protein